MAVDNRRPALLSSSRMRGSILCCVYLWIPAYAGMTGESFRNPVPELVEGCPALLSSSRMRGSILCSLYLWIPAYAGMTDSDSRQPSPRAFVILANAGIHSLLRVSLDSRLRGNDGQWQSPTVAYASGSE